MTCEYFARSKICRPRVASNSAQVPELPSEPLLSVKEVAARLGVCRATAYRLCERGESCTVLAVQADGRQVMTVEGLEKDGKLHPIQEGFWQMHGLQCGFCTPGMLMTGYALLQENRNPSEEQIRQAISGNLCRCTGYVNIVKSVEYAAEKLR